MTLAQLNALDEPRAREELARCCGARRWAARMAAGRPFPSKEALAATADSIWAALGPADWREAFARHPRIGDKEALRRKFAATASWTAGEQAAATTASETVLDALAAGNAEYERRFGHIFIVCATGKSAEEMLALLRARLANAPEAELRVAAGEQAKITRIRLEKLLS